MTNNFINIFNSMRAVLICSLLLLFICPIVRAESFLGLEPLEPLSSVKQRFSAGALTVEPAAWLKLNQHFTKMPHPEGGGTVFLLFEHDDEQRKKKLADLKAAKEKKAQCMIKVVVFLRKYFVPYCTKRKNQAKLNMWWTVLSNGLIALRKEQRTVQRKEMILFEREEAFMKEYLQEEALLIFLENVKVKQNAAASVIQSAEIDRCENIEN